MGIQDLLQCLSEPMRYSPLRLKSKVMFKELFLQYLHYCLEHKFILNYKKKADADAKHNCDESWYFITDLGRTFLEITK